MRKMVIVLYILAFLGMVLPLGSGLGKFDLRGHGLLVWAAESLEGESHGMHEAVGAAHSGGGHEVSEETGISPEQWKNLLWWTVNFLLLVAILYKFVKDPVVNIFRSRREAILNEYEDLMAKKREAEKRYAELQEKLKGLEAEAKRLMEAFREQGEREKERIIAEARENAERIKQQAEFYIQQEVNRVKAELRKEVAEMAVKMAEELIRKNITIEDHKRLFDEFIEKVERVH